MPQARFEKIERENVNRRTPSEARPSLQLVHGATHLMDKEDATVQQPSTQGTKQSPLILSTKSGNSLKAQGELVHH